VMLNSSRCRAAVKRFGLQSRGMARRRRLRVAKLPRRP
jgi:hypothetical protein